MLSIQCNKPVTEIQSSNYKTKNRHNYIVYQRAYQLIKSTTDNHTDCKV